MVLRIAKLIANPREPERVPAEFAAFTDAFTRRQPGNLAVRLWRSLDTPNAFFIHSAWSDLPSMRAAVEHATYREIVDRAQALQIERLTVWESLVVDVDPRAAAAGPEDDLPDPELALLRVTRASVRPGCEERFLADYHRYTNAVTRTLPGNCAVHLARCLDPANVYFILTWWRTAGDFAAFRDGLDFDAMRAATFDYLEERLQGWSLRVEFDDPRAPMTRARV